MSCTQCCSLGGELRRIYNIAEGWERKGHTSKRLEARGENIQETSQEKKEQGEEGTGNGCGVWARNGYGVVLDRACINASVRNIDEMVISAQRRRCGVQLKNSNQTEGQLVNTEGDEQ